MSKTQRIVLGCTALGVFALLLFPPFHYEAAQGSCCQMGYHFVLTPPREHYGATIDTGTLLTLWVGILLVGGLALLIVRRAAGQAGCAKDSGSGERG